MQHKTKNKTTIKKKKHLQLHYKREQEAVVEILLILCGQITK